MARVERGPERGPEREKTCPDCRGTGKKDGKICPRCDGRGSIPSW
jgi:DnaJ-class molecular chaperone